MNAPDQRLQTYLGFADRRLRPGYTARPTLDITPTMRSRIKVSAFTRGGGRLLVGLLEREFPEQRRESTP